MSLCVRLERPVAVEVHRALQLRLVETDDLWAVLGEDLVETLLLLLGVDASHVVVHDGELVALLQRLLWVPVRFLPTGVFRPSLFLPSCHISSSLVVSIVLFRFADVVCCSPFACCMLLWYVRLVALGGSASWYVLRSVSTGVVRRS